MYARVVVGVGKGVLYREVSSVQGCPYRGVPLYICYWRVYRWLHVDMCFDVSCVSEFPRSQTLTCLAVSYGSNSVCIYIHTLIMLCPCMCAKSQ